MKLYGLRCVIRDENNQKFDKSMTTDNDSVGVKPNQVTGISRAEHFGSPMFKPAQTALAHVSRLSAKHPDEPLFKRVQLRRFSNDEGALSLLSTEPA